MSSAVERGVVGAVLCGGASRRMGTDKALVEVRGRAMARAVADALARAGCARVVAVGGDREALESVGLTWIADRWPGEGPLGGLVTALGWADAAAIDPERKAGDDPSALVLAPCDWLDPSPTLVRALVDARKATEADTVGVAVGGRIQWLPSVWRVQECLPVVRRVFDSGQRRLSAPSLSLVSRHIAVDLRSVADADTPDDLPSQPSGGPSH